MPQGSDNISFLEHLEELRGVLLKMLAAFLLCCIPCWYLSQKVLDLLLSYSAPADFPLHYFTLMEPFVTRLKITAFLSFMLTIPWSGHCLWRFLAPGLYADERRSVRFAFISIVCLAFIGGGIALFFIVPALVHFSLSFATESMRPVIGIGEFTDLVMVMMLAAMALFQFPVVLYLLLRLGIISLSMLRSKRPHVIVLIFILAAVFSPPDVLSQLLLAIPSWLLFEASLLYFDKVFSDTDSGYNEIYAGADNSQSNLNNDDFPEHK